MSLSDADLAAIRERIEKAKNWKADEMFVTADGSRIQWADPDDPSNPYTVASSAYTDDEVNVDGAAFLRLALAAFRSQPRLVAEVDRLRAKETESEWEYAVQSAPTWTDGLPVIEPMRDEEAARRFVAFPPLWASRAQREGSVVVRRRKAGPWEPVEAGEGDD